MSENKPELKKEKIRIFMLGGLDEDGKNMICVEVERKNLHYRSRFEIPGRERIAGNRIHYSGFFLFD